MFYVKTRLVEPRIPSPSWSCSLIHATPHQSVFRVGSLPEAQRLAAWFRRLEAADAQTPVRRAA